MTYFIFCIHNHQPVGNFDNVIEEAYENSYGPFLKALHRHPSIKITLHTTGFLLDWIIEKRPEYIEILKDMVGRGQAEIMGGGYYEPVLQVIPPGDRLNQITMMSDRIEEIFGCRPRGIWLAERVWEPELPSKLKKAGIEYLLVDDYHFIKSGLKREELGGYYITEDQGNIVKVLPGSEALRYLIPFKPVDDLEEYFRGLKAYLKKGNAAIYGDDGEKFGVWPGTAKWVFEEGWLESFFDKMEELDWVKPVTISEYIDAEEPVGMVYLPTTSYMEMGEWALPAEASRDFTGLVEDIKSRPDGDRIRRFLQGGTWRNFFSKYPEANWMHKRMLLVSRELRSRSEGRLWDEHLSGAELRLFKAQCNDAYWHGVFGGLYLPHLRTEVYKNLIEAENILNIDVDHGAPVITVQDIDADNHEEVFVRTKDLNIFLSPRNGGTLTELDFRPRAVNLSNTLSRWYEGYHYKLEERASNENTNGDEAKSIHDVVRVKEEGLERYLKYDTSRRTSLVDRFIAEDATLDVFFSKEFTDLGDFAENGYQKEIKGRNIIFKRLGHVRGGQVHITKEIIPGERNTLEVRYTIKNVSATVGACRFGVEFNFLLPCCEGPACRYEMAPPVEDIGLGSRGVAGDVERVKLMDTIAGVSLAINADKPSMLWRFPVHTVSLSEGGFEKIYQGSCLFFSWPVRLERPGAEYSFAFSIEAESLL